MSKARNIVHGKRLFLMCNTRMNEILIKSFRIIQFNLLVANFNYFETCFLLQTSFCDIYIFWLKIKNLLKINLGYENFFCFKNVFIWENSQKFWIQQRFLKRYHFSNHISPRALWFSNLPSVGQWHIKCYNCQVRKIKIIRTYSNWIQHGRRKIRAHQFHL